jgi:hypothetical protein
VLLHVVIAAFGGLLCIAGFGLGLRVRALTAKITDLCGHTRRAYNFFEFEPIAFEYVRRTGDKQTVRKLYFFCAAAVLMVVSGFALAIN